MVLIEILVAYPVIKVIVSNEFALKCYIALWLIMVSCKQVLTIRSIPKQFFDILQLPFFQTREYIGGTVLAHYPTECLGVFVTLGLLIRSLSDGKVTSIKKCIIAFAGVMSFFGIILYAGRLITTERPIDLIMQPIQIQVVMMSAAGILLFYKLYGHIGKRVGNISNWLSKHSLGVYVIHPFIIGMIGQLVAGFSFNPVLKTIIKGSVTFLISLFLSFIIKLVVPERISRYLL